MNMRILLVLGIALAMVRPAAANEMTKMLQIIEEQQRIIRQQHDALMALLRERGTVPSEIKSSPKSIPAPVVATPVPTSATLAAPRAQQASARAKLDQGGAINGSSEAHERGKWYAGGSLRLVAPDRESVSGNHLCVEDTTNITSGSGTGRGVCEPPRDQTSGRLTATTDFGFGGTAVVGRRIFDIFRTEAELGLTTIGIDKVADYNGTTTATRDAFGSVTLLTGAVNGIADIPTGTFVTPYLGLGVGAFYADLSNIRTPTAKRSNFLDDSDFGFLGQALAGLSFDLDKDWAMILGYRYVVLPDVGGTTSRNQRGDATIDLHQVEIGMRRYF